MLTLAEHKLRRVVVREMHLRRWPRLTVPCQVVQFLRVVDVAERAEEQDHLADLPAAATLQSQHSRHMVATFAGGLTFTWERHSEASSATVFVPGSSSVTCAAELAGEGAAELLRWAASMPGKVLRATRIFVVTNEEAAKALLAELEFDATQLVSCYIGGGLGEGGARIWSDFRIRDDGLGMALVAVNDLDPADLARAVQRLQELGNYRNLALLGLPVAREGWHELDAIESELERLTSSISDEAVTDDSLLEEITSISIRLITRASADDYRMDATEAYAQIVEDRLADLAVRSVRGYLSLTDFTQRRFLPAVRTCASHRRRTQLLALRAEQFVALFRSRIDTRIENQNGRLLASMERNTVRQLRLQQLVEGLSVVALSYYAISLIGHVLEGVEAADPRVHAAVITSLLTPLTLVLLWWGIKRAKHKRLSEEPVKSRRRGS